MSRPPSPRRLALRLLGLTVGLLVAAELQAFPGFARKYSPTSSLFTFMPCAGCHDTFPKLTPFGRRFKENGFRMEGDSASWLETIKAYPVALRATSFTTGIGADGGSTFGVVKPISAASLGRSVSFWIEQPFYVDGDEVERLELEQAWVGAYDLLPGARPALLNLRAGAFELDLPFPQARTHNLFAYDPYFLSGGDPEWSLAAPQRGFEASGRLVDWARYSVAFTDSVRHETGIDRPFRGDLYARFAADVQRTHRLGVFLYQGRDDLVLEDGKVRATHRRFGGDFDLRFPGPGVSVYGLYLLGRDSGFGAPGNPHGGFVQAEKLARSWLLLTTRYSHVHTGEAGADRDGDALALGAHAWLFERWKLSFEYRFQSGARPNGAVLSLDFAL